MTEKDNQELLELFRKMSVGNQTNMMAYMRIAYSAQETTKQHYGLDREPPAQTGKSA